MRPDALSLHIPATAKLSDVASINPRMGEKPAADDLVSFVPMAALSAQTASVVAEETRPYGEVSKGYTPFQDGDVLVAKITPCFENNKIGQAKLTRAVGLGSTEFHVVRPRPGKADARYLMHFLRQDHVRREGERKMTGSAGQRRVPEHVLADLDVPLPPLGEQRRLAAILDQADALRAKRQTALARLDEMAQAIFVEIFGNPTAIPTSCPHSELGSICHVRGGKRLPKGDLYAPGVTSHPYIRVSDMSGGSILSKNLAYLTSETQKKISRYTVDSGDIIISIAGTIGEISTVPDNLSGANLTENAAKLVTKGNGIYHPAYLAAYLRMPFAQKHIGARTGQVTIGKLALFRIEQLPVLVPPMHLQAKYVNVLQRTNALQTLAEAQATELDTLFASLQHRAFTGTL